MDELLECPVGWCKDSQPQIYNATPSCYIVRCNECGTETPYCFTKSGAITAWNTRSTPTKQPVGETTSLREQVRVLREALQALFDDYKQLADSGDAGFWKLENTKAGKLALDALAQKGGERE